jgi:hypothetical protein
MEDKIVLDPKKLDRIDISKLKRPDSGKINIIKELRRTQNMNSEKMQQALIQAAQEDKLQIRDSVLLSAQPKPRKGSFINVS